MNLKETFYLLIFKQTPLQQFHIKYTDFSERQSFDPKKQQAFFQLLQAPSTCYSYRTNFYITHADRVLGRQRARIINFLPVPLFIKAPSTEMYSFLHNSLFVLNFKLDYIFPYTQFLANVYTPFNNEAIKFLSFIQKSQRRRFEINNTLISNVYPYRRSKRRWNLFLRY